MARPGSMGKVTEKPKNLGASMKRLLSALRPYRIGIIVSLLLAIGGSVLSIITPNRLSDLVDEITQGMTPKMEKMAPLEAALQKGFASNQWQPITLDGVTISVEDQQALAKQLQAEARSNQGTDPEADQQAKLDQLKNLPASVQELIEPEMPLAKIKKMALTVAVLYLMSALMTFGQSILMTEVANRFAKSLRTALAHKMNQLPLSFFDQNTIGDILSRVTNDIDTIAQSMNQSMASLVSAVVLLLGTTGMMIYTNWQMALTAIGSSLLGFALMFAILSKSQKYFAMRQKSLGVLNGQIEEVYSGLDIVKVYNAKPAVQTKFDQANEEVYQANQMSQFLSGMMMPLMFFVGNLGYVAVCIVGAILTLRGETSFGVIVAFMAYIRLFTSPLSQIGQAMTAIQSTGASADRVFEIMDAPNMDDESHLQAYLDPQKAQGRVSFRDVSFTYEGNQKPTLEHFTAEIQAGQKVAIVGPTGAGKTTLVNLLMKFYPISKGDIVIDDHSIKDLSRENVHDLFTMVLQDTWLFKGTVRENIAYNRMDVSEEQLNDVLKVVGLDHFVKTLPQGLDSTLEESESVSQGQRQLLTIARAMVDDKAFLILDEATSNVDTRSEVLVQKAMDALTQGRTSFIIAHRLSTIKNADLILVMKDGNIIEQGQHDQLIQAQGFYADLYQSQFSQ